MLKIGNLIAFFAAFFAVLCRNTVNTGLAGVSIAFSLNFSGILNNFVRISTDFESNITSIEAIKEYCELKCEADWQSENKKPAADWPQHGHVLFRDYSVKYRDDQDFILHNLNMEIMSGEKIGVVGRTGMHLKRDLFRLFLHSSLARLKFRAANKKIKVYLRAFIKLFCDFFRNSFELREIF
jgi:ATP-binding cassette subfamily C (CFTR/MRP) protein 1